VNAPALCGEPSAHSVTMLGRVTLESADDSDPRHLRCDAIRAAYDGDWDLLIAHPECTYLANSGAKHLYAGMSAANGPNPDRWAHHGRRGSSSLPCGTRPSRGSQSKTRSCSATRSACSASPTRRRSSSPWQFGHGETKATCLWLKGLPPLQPTNIVEGRDQRIWSAWLPANDRKRERSRTFEGIAAAMAAQWGSNVESLAA
jgi:hypothetical protein